MLLCECVCAIARNNGRRKDEEHAKQMQNNFFSAVCVRLSLSLWVSFFLFFSISYYTRII